MKQPKAEPHPTENLLVLSEDFQYLNWVIPRGFTWDGASIPRGAWLTTGSPFYPKYLLAGLVHDFLYREGEIERKAADELFYHLLSIRPDVGRYTAYKMYLGVRAGGWAAWRRHRKND